MGIDISWVFNESFYYIAPILSTITVFLTGLINNKFGIQGEWKQIMSWIIGSALSVAAYFLGAVQLGQPTWAAIIALCVVVSLISNGEYDINFIKGWIDKLFPKKQ